VVTAVRRDWRGAVELDVTQSGGDTCRALAYPALTGRPEPGDRVLLNTTALAQGLGTGGYAFVVAVPDRLPPDPAPGGHMIKARYTPLQATVLGVDEQDSPHHEVLRDADDLGGMPVVVADLHSALPAILAGARAGLAGTAGDGTAGDGTAGDGTARDSATVDGAARDGLSADGLGAGGLGADAAAGPSAPRAVYVMQDGGALPAWFSRSCAGLREAGWLAGTVTTGQSMGGDLEAVTLHTGLLAARHVLGADLAVVTQGPGNLGTGTRWGFSGVACGEAVNAASVLNGAPVASLRISDADPRPRHRGISHHSLTAYGRVALARADVVVPDLPGQLGTQVTGQAAALAGRHRLVRVKLDGLAGALRSSPVPLSTMGRGLDQDLAYFLAAAAAGRHAAALLGPSSPRGLFSGGD